MADLGGMLPPPDRADYDNCSALETAEFRNPATGLPLLWSFRVGKRPTSVYLVAHTRQRQA